MLININRRNSNRNSPSFKKLWARDAKPVRFLYQIRVRLITTSTTNVHYTNEKHKNTNVIMQKNMNFGLVQHQLFVLCTEPTLTLLYCLHWISKAWYDQSTNTKQYEAQSRQKEQPFLYFADFYYSQTHFIYFSLFLTLCGISIWQVL